MSEFYPCHCLFDKKGNQYTECEVHLRQSAENIALKEVRDDALNVLCQVGKIPAPEFTKLYRNWKKRAYQDSTPDSQPLGSS